MLVVSRKTADHMRSMGFVRNHSENVGQSVLFVGRRQSIRFEKANGKQSVTIRVTDTDGIMKPFQETIRLGESTNIPYPGKSGRVTNLTINRIQPSSISVGLIAPKNLKLARADKYVG